MSSSGPDYEQAVQNRWRANMRSVRHHLNEFGPNRDNLERKIATFAWQFGYEPDDIRKRIVEDDMFCATFAVNPRRQNLDEDTALQWLKGLREVCDCKKLPAAGRDAHYVSRDGDIRTGRNFHGQRPSKSLDFTWKTGSTRFYAMHKRTTGGSGGAQDNVRQEVRKVLENFRGCTAEGQVLVAILDGDYWEAAKLDEMQQLAREHPPRSYVAPASAVPTILKSYLCFQK